MSSRAHGKMHQVSVTATKNGSGEVKFEPDSKVWNHSDGEFVFRKDEHGMRKDDYHLLEFVLDDQTGDGLKFPSSPHEAMWVAPVEDRANPQCPDKDTRSDYEVIEPICVADEGERLIVRNHNPKQQHWAFTLNFVKRGEDQANADRYVSWDPIINNGNGGAGGTGTGTFG